MSHDTFLSFVLLKELRPLAPAVLINAANAKLEAIGAQAVVEAGGERSAPFIVNISGRRFTVLFVNQPVPASELAEAVGLERQWSSVREEVAQHRAHAIVAPLDGPEMGGEAVSSAIFVTQLSASLVETMGAIGVYWASAKKLSSASQFLSQASGIPLKRVPLLAWLQLTFVNGPMTTRENPSVAVVTNGLTPFVGRELEWRPDTTAPAVAAERVLNIAAYLISNGLVIGDGHTMEVAPGEMIRATYSDRGHRPGTATIQLQRLSPTSSIRPDRP